MALFLVELRWPVAHFIFSLYSIYDSLAVSASQDAGGYAISRQNNRELQLGCHTCWLSYFTLECLWYGRTVGRMYGHVITKTSRQGRLPNFLTHCAPLRPLPSRGAPLLGKPSRNVIFLLTEPLVPTGHVPIVFGNF